MNVISGERYKTAPDEIIQYAAGLWGADESESIDPSVRDKILANPRAKQVATKPSEVLSLRELRKIYGGPGISDEDMIMRYFIGEEAVSAMHAAGPPKPWTDRQSGFAGLIEQVSRSERVRHVRIEADGVSLRLN